MPVSSGRSTRSDCVGPPISGPWSARIRAATLTPASSPMARSASEYPDGCVVELNAPAVVNIAPGHDASVQSDEPAVLIEMDYEADTTTRLGVVDEHRH